MSLTQRRGLIDSLYSLVAGLKLPGRNTEWGEYYRNTNYTTDAAAAKESMVAALLDRCIPGMTWDLGANNGRFSQLAVERGHYTVAMDVDPNAVEQNFRARRNQSDMLPLRIDLRNPSPGNGWNSSERLSLAARGPADNLLALALIHHLVISNNVPVARVATWMAQHVRRHLIIEFVPREDSMVQRLLASREDIFSDYRIEIFEEEFMRWFVLEDRVAIPGTQRTLYLLKRKALTDEEN